MDHSFVGLIFSVFSEGKESKVHIFSYLNFCISKQNTNAICTDIDVAYMIEKNYLALTVNWQ